MTTTTEIKAERASFWGLLELMGHQRLAGEISETTIAGAGMLRIDVPANAATPGYTRYFAPSALYGITLMGEQEARAMAGALGARPVQAYELPELRARQGAMPIDDDDDDDGGHW